MPIDLAAALPQLLPRAIEWVEAQEAKVQRLGTPLSLDGIALARAVGVVLPEMFALPWLTACRDPTIPNSGKQPFKPGSLIRAPSGLRSATPSISAAATWLTGSCPTSAGTFTNTRLRDQ